MDRTPRNSPHMPASLRRHRASSKRQSSHHCPYCSKQYRTSTWLDNHVKAKHTTSFTQDRWRSLRDKIHDRRRVVSNTPMLSQPSALQEWDHSALLQGLQTMSSSVKSLLHLIDDHVALLHKSNDFSSKAHSIDRSHLQDLKRRASSQELHGQKKRRGFPTSVSDFYVPPTAEPMHWNELESRYTSPVATLWEGNYFAIGSPEQSLGVARYPYPEHRQSTRLPLSKASVAPSRSPTIGYPQQHKSRFLGAPDAQDLTNNSTPAFQELPSRHKGRMSPCGHLTPYPYETSLAQLGSGWTPLDPMEQLTDTQLQKSLDLPNHKPGESLSSLNAFQQYPDCAEPEFQYEPADAFRQQYGIWNTEIPDQPGLNIPRIQNGDSQEDDCQTPLHYSLP